MIVSLLKQFRGSDRGIDFEFAKTEKENLIIVERLRISGTRTEDVVSETYRVDREVGNNIYELLKSLTKVENLNADQKYMVAYGYYVKKVKPLELIRN